MISYGYTRLTVAILDPIIYEGLSFNLDQKPSLEKILDLARNVSRSFNHHNIKLIFKDLLVVIHD